MCGHTASHTVLMTVVLLLGVGLLGARNGVRLARQSRETSLVYLPPLRRLPLTAVPPW